MVRDFWRAEATVAELAPRLSASGDLFDRGGRRAWASVNFVTAHDGFTLNDWASYNDKHNEANGENNKDGSSTNRCWNCGAEGPTDDDAIVALRNRQKRNMLATLLFAQGTPMMLGGDEFGRSQQGNNNAYCQDSEISWFDWKLDADANALLAFTKRLIELRKAYPALRRSRFLTGQLDETLGVRDVTWINANGSEMQEANWTDASMKCFGMLLDGRAQTTGIKRRGENKSVLIVLNSFEDIVEFTLPPSEGVDAWSLKVDTNIPDRTGGEAFKAGSIYQVTGRSPLLFAVNGG